MKTRRIVIDGDIAIVPLSKGYSAIIDPELAELIGAHNWSADVKRSKDGTIMTVYAMRGERREDGKRRLVYLHRVVLGAAAGVMVDHKDGDGLNNRRANLREATHSQNGQNSRISVRNTTGVKGVSRFKERGKFQAHICARGKRKNLGLFTSLDAAAQAYAKASAELHGEFGRVK